MSNFDVFFFFFCHRRAIRAAGVDSGQFVPAVVVCDAGVFPGQPEVIDFVNVILNVVTAFF